MSSRNLRLRQVKKKVIVVSSLVAAISTMSFLGYEITHNISEANADTLPMNEKVTGDYIFEDIPQYNFKVESYPLRNNISVKNDFIGTTQLPTTYDSRALGYVSRQENQAGEGLCWAYSFTTAAESYLLRNGLISNVIELSPKQLDYILAPASQSFSDSTSNKYEDYIYSITQQHRDLTDGSNFFATLMVTSGKYSLTEDGSFFNKMKLNDSATLGDFNTYGDYISNLYNLAHEDYINNGSTNLPITYTTKQKYADVFNKNDAAYAITGADFVGLGYYSSSDITEDRQNAITEIKNGIMNYGAVAIASHYNEDLCMYKDGQNYTIIDRTNQHISMCDLSGATGHGMTLVGWDDNWSYKDGETDKTGAFIIQNSYGDDDINYYLSYNSYANATMITDMQEANPSSDVFDVSDFTKTVDADNYEVIFDFNAIGNRELYEISAFISPITGESQLGWDIYVKSGSGQYKKVGRIDDGVNFGLHSIKNLETNLSGNFSIKIKYDNAGHTINGFTPEIFSTSVAPYMAVVAYATDDASSENEDPDPTPSDPTGKIIWASDDDYIIGSGEDLVVKVDYPLTSLTDVTLDDKTLSDEYYKTESGSTILTIYGDYLDTLEEGTHTIELIYDSYDPVSIEFTVSEEDLSVPSTSGNNSDTLKKADTGRNTKEQDGSSFVLTYLLPTIIVISVTGYLAYRGKKRVNFDHK